MSHEIANFWVFWCAVKLWLYRELCSTFYCIVVCKSLSSIVVLYSIHFINPLVFYYEPFIYIYITPYLDLHVKVPLRVPDVSQPGLLTSQGFSYSGRGFRAFNSHLPPFSSGSPHQNETWTYPLCMFWWSTSWYSTITTLDRHEIFLLQFLSHWGPKRAEKKFQLNWKKKNFGDCSNICRSGHRTYNKESQNYSR